PKPYYIKALREKVCLFLCYQPNDSIEQIKSNLCKALENKKTPKEVRLLIESDRPGEYTPLEDTKSIENGAVVYFVYLETIEGHWEPVNVIQPQLDDEVEEPVVTKKEKGKRKA
ncbi:hypothetical protein CU098_012992, partial [Rhizopus stolonifer]